MRLIFNACEGHLQLLLTNNQVIICAQDWNTPNSSTEILAPSIQQILASLNLLPADINSIACVNGPGSFTGIRLTLATAAAMRRVLNIPLASINYLQALALSCHIYLAKQLFMSEINDCTKSNELFSIPSNDRNTSNNSHTLCWVLTHAKKNFVHAQLYEFNLEAKVFLVPKPASSIKLFSIEAICELMQLNQDNLPMYCLGSGLIGNFTVIRQCCPHLYYLNIAKVCTASLNMLAQVGIYEHTDLEPIYTRHCDAIDNLSSIAIKQGLDPEKRHAELRELLMRPPTPL